MPPKPSLKIVSWDDVKPEIYRLKPALAEAIDNIKEKERPPLFIAKYPFGANLVEKGTLMLPSESGEIVPISHQNVLQEARELLTYCSIPLCLWLNSNAEVYIDIENRRIPLNVFMPGSICGLWETLDTAFSKRIWSIAVGCKSIFTLSKISDSTSLKRIEKKYGFHSAVIPKSIFDQSDLFSQIISHQDESSEWASEVMFFSKGWFENKSSDKNWMAFQYHLLNEEWRQSIYWRNKITFDIVGQIFSLAQKSKNLKPNPYLIDTAMYLVAIGVGSSPGFTPITDNESFAPISKIQKIITEDYGLKDYIPTLMCPNYLSATNPDLPVYYSMQIPTMLGASQNLTKPHSVLDDMRMVKRLLESLRTTLEKMSSSMYDLIKNVEFDFFHTEPDKYSGIKSTVELSETDKRFTKYHEKERRFCETSSFLRGCVRIKRK